MEWRQYGLAIWLIVIYVVGTRISPDGVGKFGISAGGIGIFSTEILIVLLSLIAFLKNPAQLTIWLLSGSGAGFAGATVWVLFWSSIIYALLGFHAWQLLAIRDLAIFGYSVIFTLAYIVIDTKPKALFVLKAFIASSVITALALIGDSLSGLHLLYLEEIRSVANSSDALNSIGGGDVGASAAASVGALLILAGRTGSNRPSMRYVYLGLAGVCLLALIIAQTRSASFGAAIATALALSGMRIRNVVALGLGLIAIGLVSLALVALMPGAGAATLLQNFATTMHSGAELTEDPNFAFRYLRWVYVVNEWRSAPYFGIGFGVPLVPADYISGDEIGLNAGLPHNTYLTILARMGLFGLLLFALPWLRGILLCFERGETVDSSDYQRMVSTILLFFAGFAGFVLFFERPWHSAAFWIMLAVAYRLAGSGIRSSVASNELSARA